MRFVRYPWLTLIFMLPALAVVNAPAVRASDTSAFAKALRSALDTAPQSRISAAHRGALEVYYEARGWQPVWADAGGPTRAAKLAIEELKRAGDFGLDDDELALPAANLPVGAKGWTPEQASSAEIEISSAILNYARQARGGRITDPQVYLSSYLDRRPGLPDPIHVIMSAAIAEEPDAHLRSYHPAHPQFWKLKGLYAQQRGERAMEKTNSIAIDGPLLVPGMRHDDVRALRARLKVPAIVDSALDVYDDTLVAAVKSFQDTNGLKDDGYVGTATRRKLNARPRDTTATLRANLEKWRWMPEDLGQTHLLANVPSFTIALYQDGSPLYEERIIAGKPNTQTPIFSKTMKTIVFRPDWKMPDSIKVEKILAAQRSGTTIEDQGYVIKKGSKTVDSTDVDWSKATLSHYEFTQPSGDGNALGNVKFLFPNKHSVYLHDTPTKKLFNEDVRLFSHGCVRLRNPLDMAQRLLDLDKGADALDVNWLVKKGPGGNAIQLDTPLPIHIAYFTAWVATDGTLHLFDDVYGHEQRVTLALAGKWSEIDKGDDHLAAVDTVQLQDVKIVQRSAPVAAVARPARRFSPPMGVTNASAKVFDAPPPVAAKPSFFAKPAKYKSDGGVGDIMRNSLMGH